MFILNCLLCILILEVQKLLSEISRCKICEPELDLGARPVVSLHKKSKIIIIGQAPGTKVHASGIPWDDKSGEKLRSWMDISREVFYDPRIVGIVPMGFCYPGKGKSGDLPPRKECAPQWHELLFAGLEEVKLILLIGAYSQKYYLKKNKEKNLTETVINFEKYLPKYFVLPHPSPRNNIWMRKNDWFEKSVIPALQSKVKQIIK